jgi:transposase
MSLKPAPVRLLPPELVTWAEQHLPPESPYRLVGDLLYPDLHDDLFADCYHKEGRPAVSPVILSLVTLFQSLENLPDRAAAFAAVDRRSWQYAMHLPADFAGFDASILVDFRKRLLAHDAEARIFEHVLHTMQVLGLLKARGIQRTDSLSLFTKARKLTRIEFMVETMRVTLRAVVKADKTWAQANLAAEWEARYAKICRSEHLDKDQIAGLSVQTGDDGQLLLDLLDADDGPAALRDLFAVTVLRTVWSQHYAKGDDGHLAWVTTRNAPGAERIETPHDPEARWSSKRDQGWNGHKLQVTETDDADLPHLITDIAVTSATVSDFVAIDAIRARQKQHDVLPGERYADSGYVSGETIASGATDFGEDLIGRIRHAPPTPQSQMPDGLTHADFQIDWEGKQVTCPAGHTAVMTTNGKRPERQATFQAKRCRACPLHDRCCTGTKDGRTLRFGIHYPETMAARARQRTDAFKRAYRLHRSGIEGCLSSLVRGQGIRTNHYCGRAKNHMRALFVGAAVNLDRAAAWRAGTRRRRRAPSLGLSPGAALPCPSTACAG